jgi:hypothetical protein
VAHQLGVHVHFAKLVDDDGDFLTVVAREQVIDEGGFAGAQEANQDANRNGSGANVYLLEMVLGLNKAGRGFRAEGLNCTAVQPFP